MTKQSPAVREPRNSVLCHYQQGQLWSALSLDNAILLCVTDTSHPPDTGKAGLGQSAMLVALQDGAQIMQDHIANQVSTTLDSGGAVRR